MIGKLNQQISMCCDIYSNILDLNQQKLQIAQRLIVRIQMLFFQFGSNILQLCYDTANNFIEPDQFMLEFIHHLQKYAKQQLDISDKVKVSFQQLSSFTQYYKQHNQLSQQMMKNIHRSLQSNQSKLNRIKKDQVKLLMQSKQIVDNHLQQEIKLFHEQDPIQLQRVRHTYNCFNKVMNGCFKKQLTRYNPPTLVQAQIKAILFKKLNKLPIMSQNQKQNAKMKVMKLVQSLVGQKKTSDIDQNAYILMQNRPLCLFFLQYLQSYNRLFRRRGNQISGQNINILLNILQLVVIPSLKPTSPNELIIIYQSLNQVLIIKNKIEKAFQQLKQIPNKIIYWEQVLNIIKQRQKKQFKQKDQFHLYGNLSQIAGQINTQINSYGWIGKTISSALKLNKYQSKPKINPNLKPIKKMTEIIRLALDRKYINQLIQNICKSYEIDQSDIDELFKPLIDFARQRVKLYLAHRKKIHKKQQNINIAIYCVQKALKYLKRQDLLKVILLSKQAKTLLQMPIINSLLDKNIQEDQLRLKLWQLRLNSSSKASLYWGLTTNRPKIQDLSIVINQDLKRTFYQNKYFSQQKVIRILQTFSSFFQQVQYIQGMNFLASFLLIKAQGQQNIAFGLLVNLVQLRFGKTLYKNFDQIQNMMRKFFKLLQLYQPQIYNHLLKQQIKASYFMINWIISLFSSNYKSTYQTVDSFWDLFVSQGWKAFYKMLLLFFKKKRNVILSLQFQQLMKFLGKVTGQVLNDTFINQNFKHSMHQMKLTNSQLANLQIN